MTPPHKIQITFTPDELAKIDACEEATGAGTLARVIRDALVLAAWAARARADGWTLVAVRGTHTREWSR